MAAARTFERMDLQGFFDLLDQFPFERRINAVHMHHTWRPTRAQWSQHGAEASLQSMWRFHTQERGFTDIAQHVTIDPDGGIWTGRNWNLPPASAVGNNGTTNAGPFMFEMVGDFDKGREPWDGKQRENALAVAALVLARFKLTEGSLRFHNQMADKTCPGTQLVFADVASAVGSLIGTLPQQLRTTSQARGAFDADSSPQRTATRRAIALLDGTRQLSRDLADRVWTDDGELAEERTEPENVARMVDSRDAAPAAERAPFTPEQLEQLRPHVVNLRFGAFSSNGIIRTRAEDVDRIFREDLPRYLAEQRQAGRKARLLFYAHGGLVKEEAGLAGALDQLGFHRANNVYPIFFVWETGLLEVLADILRSSLGGARGALSDISDRLIEALARDAGLQVWGHMKRSAEVGVLQGGGALTVAQRAAEFVRSAGGDLEVHAAGHSAGAIFMSHFLPALSGLGVSPVRSLHLLAPAVNVPTFKQMLLPLITARTVEKVRMYTMKEVLEKDDTAGPYKKSLLYLVKHAFEEPDETPILGLEEDLRGDGDLRALFGLNGVAATADARIAFSITGPGDPLDLRSRSVTHGGFDNDADTMNSMERTVLGVGGTGTIANFEQRPAVRRFDEDPMAVVERELRAPVVAAATPAPASGRRGFGAANAAVAAGSAPASGESGIRPQPADAAVPKRPDPVRGPDVIVPTPPAAVRAICVGIDHYSRKPLNGCVNDSRTWAEAFRRLGFSVESIPETQATRDNLTALLKDAVARVQPGGTFVFQFAGHGIQIPDQGNGDEPDDEAFVPIDFERNGFVRDDDVRAILDGLPAGSQATMVIDCCHSGGLSRMLSLTNSRALDEQARELEATPDLIAIHRRTRRPIPRSRALTDAAIRRDFWLMACQKAELAWESSGQGDFTRLVAPLLTAAALTQTYAAFQSQVDGLFVSNLRQHPLLDCDARFKTVQMFAPAAV